ncbi:MAG: glycosyltransferase family 4 protein [Rhodospirillaceae bacterium]|nr:glycosyltransferase family 4 protein [Rhodospirillaceae bacterium]
MSDSFKVNISVHGRWHAFELANGLYQQGHLGRLLTTYPGFIARRFLDAEAEIRTRPLLELRRRVFDRFGLGSRPDASIAARMGAFAAAEAASGADILVGWSSSVLEAIAPAHAAGMKVIVERGSTHIDHQARILRGAYDSLGLPADIPLPEIAQRELAEYAAADAIAVPTEYAAETFAQEGIARDKLIVNGYGVNLSKFAPPEGDADGDAAAIVFVGRVGVRKGVPWLLRAMQGRTQCRLNLVGPVEDGFQDFLRRETSDAVTIRGQVAGDALPAIYAGARVFCLPSLEEGMPLTLLQAMAAGLAVVVTKAASGGIVEQSGAGIVVPPGDAEAIGDAFDRLINDPDLAREMGQAGRRAVQAGYGWQDYANRAIAAYRNLL